MKKEAKKIETKNTDAIVSSIEVEEGKDLIAAPTANGSRFLTLTEAAQYLNLKVSRMRYEVFHRSISYFKIGRSIRFDERDLIMWVANKKQEQVGM